MFLIDVVFGVKGWSEPITIAVIRMSCHAIHPALHQQNKVAIEDEMRNPRETNRKQWQGPERDPGGASIPSVVSQLIIESDWASPLSSLSGMGRSEQDWTRLTPVMGGTAVAIVMASQIDSEVLRGVLFVGGGRGEKRKKGKLREKLKFQ